MIYEIEKFNPYHDARGRFTNGSGAASFTIRTRDPKKQHMADAAMQRARESHASQSSRLTPPTVAGVQRGNAMSHEEADERKGNPRYLEDRKYRTNCQSCVIAYEMRRRGYDVEAAPNEGKQRPFQREVAHDAKRAWLNEDGTPSQYEGGRTDRAEKAYRTISHYDGNTKKKFAETLTPKRAAKEIDSLIGEGRYTISYIPKGQRSNGHIVVAERVNGKVRIFDPQDGKHYDLDSFAKSGKWQTSRHGYYRGDKTVWNMHPLVQRVDNKILKDDFADDVLVRKR